MAPPSQILRMARPAFRSQFVNGAARKTGFTFRTQGTARFQSSAAAPEIKVQQSWFKRMWDSPIGLKTVHFWAPVMKWCIVIAGISDLYRPAEKLSLTQNLALTATGAIWTRWCFIIKPRNILLATVNFFLGLVGVIQVSRIVNYNYSQKGESTTEQLAEAKESVKETAKEIEKKIEGAIKS